MSIRKILRRGLLTFCLLGCAGAGAAWTWQIARPWRVAVRDFGSGAVPPRDLRDFDAVGGESMKWLTYHLRPGTSVTIVLRSVVHAPTLGGDARLVHSASVRVDARLNADTYVAKREWTLGRFAIRFRTHRPPPAYAAALSSAEAGAIEYRLNRPLTSAEVARLQATGGFEFEVGAATWAWLLLFAAYPTYAFLVGPMRRRSRRRRGLCEACGYDLRGTEGDRCPECGSIIARRGELRRHSLASDAVLVPRPVRPDDAP